LVVEEALTPRQPSNRILFAVKCGKGKVVVMLIGMVLLWWVSDMVGFGKVWDWGWGVWEGGIWWMGMGIVGVGGSKAEEG
jgi:hypothetical protein